jgi:hypothetical protein|tara:strand:- start:541 stop:978 length:438 start_codon:yes stop_codon:yes gene_type:complete
MTVKPQFYEREFNGKIRDFIRISVSGLKDIFEAPVRPQDLSRFPDEWLNYKKTKGTKKIVGTSLKELPAMSEPRRIELELIGIESVEDFAKAEIQILRNLGEPYVELQRIAELTMKAKQPKQQVEVKPLNIGIPHESTDNMPKRS